MAKPNLLLQRCRGAAAAPLTQSSRSPAAPPPVPRGARAIGAEGAGTGLDPAQEREDLPLHSHLGNKHQEELNKHWKSLKSTALSKSTFTFCSKGSERGVAGEAPALRWEHEDVLFWFAFILLSFFFPRRKNCYGNLCNSRAPGRVAASETCHSSADNVNLPDLHSN